MFSLSRTVKELAPYPPPFSGNAKDNVYRFTKKMKEAIEANQVREKDKVEVLRKYLTGDAKAIIGDHYKTFKEAIDRLIETYGSSIKVWEGVKETFVKTCKEPKHWNKDGSKEKLRVVNTALEFLREADSLATDYPDQLKNTIYSVYTLESVILVFPR